MRATSGQFRRSFQALRCHADFPGKSGEHEVDLPNAGFESIVLARRDEPEVLGEQKKMVQFTGRTRGDVKILSQFIVSRPTAALGYIRGNGKRSASHLTRATLAFGPGKCGRSSIDVAYDFGREPQPC